MRLAHLTALVLNLGGHREVQAMWSVLSKVGEHWVLISYLVPPTLPGPLSLPCFAQSLFLEFAILFILEACQCGLLPQGACFQQSCANPQE